MREDVDAGGASRAGPGGSTPTQQGSGGAADPRRRRQQSCRLSCDTSQPGHHGLKYATGASSLATSSRTALRDANTPNGSRALEPPSNPAVPSHGSTLRGTALDNAFHPTRETRGPRCQEPDNGGHESCGHESCGHDWTMPHSRHSDERYESEGTD